MPQSNKRLPKGQVKKNASVKNSSLSLDSVNDSDSSESREMLKSADIQSKVASSEDCSSDEAVSDSLWSKLENDITRDGTLPTNMPTCDDDLAGKGTQKQLNAFPMCNIVLDGSSESDEDSDAESRKEILRSAEKRISRNISTSESDTRKRMHEKYETSSDSDSAPENVTFEAGRKTAMEVLKQRVDCIRQEKVKKKEQRMKKLENLKRQKEEKLVRLKGRPTGVENDSGSCTSESTRKLVDKQTTVKTEKGVILGQKLYFSSESETTEGKTKHGTGNSIGTKPKKGLKRLPANFLDSLSDQATRKHQAKVSSMQLDDQEDLQPKKKHIKVNNYEMQLDTDFIPLENSSVTQFGVVPLNKIGLRKKTVAEEAAAFRKNRLYGNKVKRTSVNVNNIRKQKLKACGMDRLVTHH